MLCFFVIFLAIYSRFLHTHLPEGSLVWVLTVIFLAALAASFFIYRFVIKIVMKKFDMEKFIEPIFDQRRPPKAKT